jgi:outer membrane receptor protein involved in Fe transport
MASYEFNEHWKLQINLNNLTNKLYYTSLYYSAVDENHAVPGPGRSVIAMLSARF